ncbi:efflux RND transporter periplasmic adaptor subunit [Arhodomonas aquaeolei]|uniref:efflux RND transporter periplasmic adaptor subunit n=1 Tax=Arhodomonas aquaeolei TaxID=2369 RepID=UPI00037D0726|nr:efflux RND transporter periplasmic adaptor subunit [Arhodomonas aquaeolei]
MTWSRRIAGAVLAVAVLGGLVYAFLPAPAPVSLAVVARGPLAVTVEREGQTRVRDRYVVAAPVSGALRRIDLDVGDAVGPGTVLTRIDPQEPELLDPRYEARARADVASAEAALHAAAADVGAAEAEAERAATELARVSRLHEQGYAPAQNLDIVRATDRRAKATLRSARFRVQVAAAELASARAVLHYGEGDRSSEGIAVRAPVAGRVLALPRESAGPVERGAPLVEIGDPASLEVRTDVLSVDAVRIHPGMRVDLTGWGGDTTLEARVSRVEPAAFTKVSALGVDEQRVWVTSQLASPHAQWNRLGDGYRVDCAFVLWSGEGVLQVPDSAVFPHGGGEAVFVASGGRAHLREVGTGRRSGLQVQIRSGLEAGERVVIHPDATLADGDRIRERAGG